MEQFSVGAINKYFPEWVWDLNKTQARLFIESMMLGDGYVNKSNANLYYTSNINSPDFTGANTGLLTIINNTATFTLNANADSITEGTETFGINIRTNSITGNIVYSSNNINLLDTSNAEIVASGGNDVFTFAGYKYHVFKSSNNFVLILPSSTSIEYIEVGGGGGGGARHSGGGGAGGFLSNTFTMSASTLTVTVGAGGAGGDGNGGYGFSNAGNTGSNTTITGPGFSTLTSYGGGGGGAYGSSTPGAAKSGGSGGGQAGYPPGSNFPAGKGVYSGSPFINSPVRQGYDGGGGGAANSGGGGGGAGAIGATATPSTAGPGGAGITNPFYPLAPQTGNLYLAGGGGGALRFGQLAAFASGLGFVDVPNVRRLSGCRGLGRCEAFGL
jgi:hypothetical protein